jgi:replicative DNA helicase
MIEYTDNNAEMAVLGAMLFDRHALSKGIEKLKCEHFYTTKHQAIFKELCTFKDKDIDLVIFCSHLKDKRLLTKIDGEGYMTDLMDKVSSSALISGYADIVVRKYYQREQNKSLLKLIQGKLTDEGKDKELENINICAVEVNNIENKSTYLKTIKEVASEFIEDYESTENNKIKIGFPSFDNNLDLEKGQMLVVAGRPEAGKSLFAMNIFNKFLIDGKKVVYFPTEMKSKKAFGRLLSIRAKTSNYKIRNKILDDDLAENTKKCSELSNTTGMFFEKSAPTINEIKSVIGTEKPDCIIIDQITDIKLNKAESKAYAIGDFIRELHSVCVDANVCCVCMAHLNRESEHKTGFKDKSLKPTIANIKYSGDIEQSADKIILIWKKEEDKKLKTINFTIGKNRDGFSKDGEIILDRNTLEMNEAYFGAKK